MQPAIDILGRHVTMVTRAVPDGQAYRASMTTASQVVLRPVLPGRPLPDLHEQVQCVSGAGRWQGRVERIEAPDHITLTLPEWVDREVRRGAVRVPVDFPVELKLAGGSAGGRLEDLSVTGGSLVVEAEVMPEPGSVIWLRTPGGEGTVMVCNHRPHPHRLLGIMGVTWEDTDAATRAWIATEVSRARTRPTGR